MMRKAALLVGLAAGYVLGARDGRERYEQIKSVVTGVAQDPRVQEQASKAADVARDKAPGLTDAVTSKVADKVDTSTTTSSTSGAGSVADAGDGLGTPAAADLDTPAVSTLDALDEEVVVVPSGPTPIDGGHDV